MRTDTQRKSRYCNGAVSASLLPKETSDQKNWRKEPKYSSQSAKCFGSKRGKNSAKEPAGKKREEEGLEFYSEDSARSQPGSQPTAHEEREENERTTSRKEHRL